MRLHDILNCLISQVSETFHTRITGEACCLPRPLQQFEAAEEVYIRTFKGLQGKHIIIMQEIRQINKETYLSNQFIY